MNAKTWIPLSAAALLGTGAAYVGYTIVGQTPVRVAAKPVKMADLVIAARDVAAGTKLAAEDLRVMSVEAATLPEGFAAAADTAVGRVARERLRAGQPIGESVLAADGSPDGLAAVLPRGYRAITIELARPAGVGEFLKPEARVDVVSGFRDGEEMTVRTVAQNLRVLAVDGLMAGQPKPAVEDGRGEQAVRTNCNVTLMVTLEQAAAVELATVMGKPRLTLRAGGDRELSAFEGLTLAEMRGVRPFVPMTVPMTVPTPTQSWRDPLAVAPWGDEQPVSTPATMPAPATRPTADPFARGGPTVFDDESPAAVRYVEVIRGGIVTHESVPDGRPRPPEKAEAPEPSRPAAPQHEYVETDRRPVDE